MATWGEFIGSIQLTLKQSFDDREIPLAQIAHWTQIGADRLNLLHTQKIDSGMLLTTFVVDILQDTTLNRRYVEIPARIFDMDFDGGIQYMCYYLSDDTAADGPRFMQVIGYRCTPTIAHVMNGHPDQRFSSREFGFFREGNKRIYLLSVDNLITKMEIGVMMAAPSLGDINLNEEMRFPAQLTLLLERHVLDLGRLLLSLPGARLSNDGTERIEQDAQDVPKVVSVNSPELNEQGA